MRTAVIGAGAAGLAAARRIRQAGGQPVVFESNDIVGGRIQTIKRDGFIFDTGAFIYMGSYTAAIDLMRELGLESQLKKKPASGAMPRDGKLHYLDLERPWKVPGTKYLSRGSKAKLAKLLLLLRKHWKDLDYDDPTGVATHLDDRTVAEYCRSELNEEILDYVAGPVVRGPWLQDPSDAAVGLLPWTMKNFFNPSFYGLDEGMDALPRAIAADLEVRTSTPVVNVTDAGGHVEVSFADKTEPFDNAVITTTTNIALEIYPQMDGVQREFYESVDYVASVDCHLAFKRRPVNLGGIPEATYIMCSPREQPNLSGVIVDHLKADNRVPAGKGMLTTFCRHEWCLENLEASDEEVLDQVFEFIRPYYGDIRADLEDYEIGRWRRVVPLMPTGYFRRVAANMKAIDPRARVQFAGDIGPIPGINGALINGRQAGDRIASQLGAARKEATVVG